MVELRIDEGVRSRISQQVQAAQVAPTSYAAFRKSLKLKSLIRQRQKPPIIVPFGHVVEYEVVEYNNARCRHLVVSTTDRRMPEPPAVLRLMREFGFERPRSEVVYWPDPDKAVHVMERID
jgi:hypothetical protein